MKDQFGRHITNLRISITDRCNLRCFYCMPDHQPIHFKPREEILSFEEILKIARIMTNLGFRYFRITGGEPLVRKGCLNFLEKLHKIPNVEKVSLTTNALLLKPNLPQLKNIGIQQLNISLDTLQPKRFHQFTLANAWQKVWDAIQLALEMNFFVKLNVVVVQGKNDDELPAFAKLTQKQNLYVRFIEYMPLGNFHENPQVLPIQKMKQILHSNQLPLTPAEEHTPGKGPATYYKIPNAKGKIGFISPVSDKFCARCNRMRLTADGKLKACLLLEQYFDLKPLLRQNKSEIEIQEAIYQNVFHKPFKHEGYRKFTMNTTGG
ncbi:MAG: GTP 3',8-cyclase MoaA [Planctomycetota bacterium]|nr:MAG: GTP 3',8-cyclase MoaA [Planctomycetota bacterium]